MDDTSRRIRNGIELLKDGFPYKVGELYMALGDDYFNITGSSQSIDLTHITKSSALNELSEIKGIFKTMLTVSPELRDLINNKKLKFNLDFDYGMGAIRVCSESDDTLKWELE